MYQTTLYAQPHDLKPYHAVPHKDPSRKGKAVNIPLTDIGSVFIKHLKPMEGFTMRLNKYSVANGEYDLVVGVKDLTVALGLRRLKEAKKGKNGAENYYLIMGFDGHRTMVHSVVTALYKAFGDGLWDISLFNLFSERVGIKNKAEIKKQWLREIQYDFEKDAARFIGVIEKIVNKGLSMGIDMADVTKMSKNGKALIKQGRKSEGLSLLELAKNAGIEKIYRYEKEHAELHGVRKRVEYIGEMINNFKKSGFDTSQIERLYAHVLDDMKAMEIKPALQKCKIIENIIKRERFVYRNLNEQIDALEKKLIEAKSLGVGDDMMEALINRARLLLKERQYSEVEKILQSINDTLGKEKKKKHLLLSQHQLAKQAINEAGMQVVEAKRHGLDVEEFEDYMNRAKIMLVANEYKAATELAEKAAKGAEEALGSFKMAKAGLEELRTAVEEAGAYITVGELNAMLNKAETYIDGENYAEALHILNDAKSRLEDLKKEHRPRITVSAVGHNLYSGQWNRCTLEMRNEGNAHAVDIKLSIKGNVEVMKAPDVPSISAGEVVSVDVGIKCDEPGDIPLDITLDYTWPQDEERFQSTETLWLTFMRPGSALLQKLEAGRSIESVEAGKGDEGVEDGIFEAIVEKLEPAQSYLLHTKERNIIFKLVHTLSTMGRRPLCITRTFPKKIRKKYSIPEDRCKILWLTRESEGGEAIKPTDLEKLGHEVRKYLESVPQPVVVFDGLNYLTTHNKFANVLKLVQSLTDKVAIKEGIFIMPIDREAMGEEQSRMIESEFDDVLEI